jgi:SAM-dependent methyltransferase
LSATHLDKEGEFHDDWADSVSVSSVRVRETFESPSCPETRFLIQELGNVNGLRILELGTGLGEASTYFSLLGAQTHATDVSLGMAKMSQNVGRYHGASFESFVMDAAYIAARSDAYDIVYAANTLHHIDIPQCLKEIHRVLKPGGHGAFWDPVCYNPIINKYRRMATQVRTDDEHPLGRADLALMKSTFSKVKVGFFGLATLGVFLKFYFVDMIHPNEERYWKKFVSDYDSFHTWYDILSQIDRFILKVPGIRWFSWNMAVVVTK